MIKIKRISCGFVNCYILSENGRAVLIDTGTVKYREKILDLCKRADVALIVLTHAHVDHMQNAAYLSEELDVPIAVGEGDEELIYDQKLQPLKCHSPLGRIIQAASYWSFENSPCPIFIPSLLLKDGDTLKDFGLNAKIIALPGHTDGSIGIDIADRFLFVGDAMTNLFSAAAPPVYADLAKTYESVIKIGTLGARKVYFGHGEPTRLTEPKIEVI